MNEYKIIKILDRLSDILNGEECVFNYTTEVNPNLNYEVFRDEDPDYISIIYYFNKIYTLRIENKNKKEYLKMKIVCLDNDKYAYYIYNNEIEDNTESNDYEYNKALAFSKFAIIMSDF